MTGRQLGKPSNSALRSEKPVLVIYQDDPRNNRPNLDRNPNIVVVEKHSPTPETYGAGLTSTQLDNQEVVSSAVEVSAALPPIDYAGSAPFDSSLTDEYFYQQNKDRILNSDDANARNTVIIGRFLFNSLTGEAYDPEAELVKNSSYLRDTGYPGTQAVIGYPTSIISDPAVELGTFTLQTDAVDGSLTWKVTVSFDEINILDDYDIILTMTPSTGQ